MSWWSALADIGLGVAAPFTGGASLAGIPAVNALAGAKSGSNPLTDASQLIGGQQAGKNNALVAQGNLNQGSDRNALTAYQDQQAAQNQAAQLDLQRQQYATKNRADVMRQALIGQLLGSGSFQPTHVSPTGSSGGILASLNANPGALQALKTFGQQGSTAQNTPLSFTGGNILTPPTLSQTPKLDTGSSALGRTGTTLGLAGALTPAILAAIKKIQDQSGSVPIDMSGWGDWQNPQPQEDLGPQ
jgi:hypothetical protein